MEFLFKFLMISYIVMFFNPRLRININGRRTNSLFYRFVGSAFFAVALTVFLGLPVLGLLSLFN